MAKWPESSGYVYEFGVTESAPPDHVEMSLGVDALACPGGDGDFYSSIRPLWAEELLCSLHKSFLPEGRNTAPLAPDSRSGGSAASRRSWPWRARVHLSPLSRRLLTREV